MRKSTACEIAITTRLRECGTAPLRVDEPRSAVDYWRDHIASAPAHDPAREHLVALLLNTRHRILGHHLVSIGSAEETVAHPREIFRAAIIHSASFLLLMHNHPSGDPSPSSGDRCVTQKLHKASEILSLPLVDHIVVGDGRYGHGDYFSFREAGLL